MMEPWEQAQALAARWDDRLRRRPVCQDCGKPVAEGWYFPLEHGQALCRRCMLDRMVEVEE